MNETHIFSLEFIYDRWIIGYWWVFTQYWHFIYHKKITSTYQSFTLYLKLILNSIEPFHILVKRRIFFSSPIVNVCETTVTLWKVIWEVATHTVYRNNKQEIDTRFTAGQLLVIISIVFLTKLYNIKDLAYKVTNNLTLFFHCNLQPDHNFIASFKIFHQHRGK